MSFYQNEYNGESILLPNTIRGYRQWTYKVTEKLLSSTYVTKWETTEKTSSCGHDRSHSAPSEGCTCGFYAHYLPLESYERVLNVLGVVEASGKIVMGTKGFRAEKVRITALSGVGNTNRWFGFTGAKTDVPELVDYCGSIDVPYFSTVGEMVEEFPQTDMSSLGVDLDKVRQDRANSKAHYDSQQEVFRQQQRMNTHWLAAKVNGQANMEEYIKLNYGHRSWETMRALGGF